MSNVSAWDEMKRVREEEFFHKDEIEKKERLKEKLKALEARVAKTNEKLESFTKGESPITGALLIKAHVHGHVFLDCPEDEMVMIGHASLLSLIESLQNDDKQAMNAWKAFLESSLKVNDE